MREAIDKSAHVEDAMAEVAAEALRSGKDVSSRSPTWRAKEQRDELIADHALLKSGFARLQAKATMLEKEVASAHRSVIEMREPIVQHTLQNLACALLVKENEAASLRAWLRGFSYCSNGTVPQKLPALALDLLRNPPKNARDVHMNTPEQRSVDRKKQAFVAWKRELENSAQAELNLNLD
jgi:hypothetical protein